MAKYRSKPHEIEATQWNTPGDHGQVARDQYGDYKVLGHQGWSTVNPGDWIIDEPDGDGHYPCDPVTFEKKYEAVG